MPKEEVKLRLPVVPELDRKGTSNLLRDIKRLESDLGKLDVSWKSIGKTASLNVKEINKITTAAGHLSKSLSSAAKDSFKELQGLGKQLSDAKEKAKNLAKEYGSSKGGKKEDVGKQLGMMMKNITDLNKQIDAQKDKTKKYNSELERGLKAQQKNIAGLKQAAGYTKTDALKDLVGSIKSGDWKGALGSVAKGGLGAAARKDVAGAATKGEAAGGAEMAAAGAAAAGLAAGAAAIMAFVQLILQASQHMADLNKGLTGGIGLAQEMGGKVGDYSKAIKNMRDAAIGAAGAMLKFGLKSKDALESVNAFAKQSGMSLSEMEIQLASMGGDNLTRGMREFAINAQVYGKALGMEAKDVAGMMGQFTNEIGISADNVTKTMGDIVKQASQSGMPVHKFMDIFHQAIPNLDLFTNRIEELTGMMKMLSKTLDPRSVKSVMQAMGKGFDQLDFKQRLKMALVIGPGEMGKIMKEDIARASAAVKKNLPAGLGKAVEQALKGGDNIKKMRKVAAMAMAKGATGAQVEAINRLGRYKELSGGGVLKQASGMREMGMMGRMEALQKLAGRFTGGDISGLGEHVAKQLGVSEEEYKAILAMQDNIGDNLASVEETGRTSSMSINNSLKKLMDLPDDVSAKDFEKSTKLALKKDPAGFKKMLMTAATMQVEQQQADAKDAAAAQESIEDLTADQVDATTSLGDKIENVIGYLLEKLFYVMNDVFGSLDDLYNALPGWITGGGKETRKALDKMASGARAELKDNQAGFAYYQEMTNKLKAIADRGGTTSDYLREGNDLMMKQLHTDKTLADKNSDYYKKVSSDLQGVFNDADRGKFIKALSTADSVTTGKMLTNLDSDKAAVLMAKLAKDEAKTSKGVGRGTSAKSESKVAERAQKKQDAIAKQQSDHDERTAKLMQGLQDAADDSNTPGKVQTLAEVTVTGSPPPGSPAAVATGTPTSAGGVVPPAVKNANEVQQQTADNTAAQAKSAAELAEQAEQDYQATSDTLSLLKKGLKFEQTWMTTKFKNVIKDASLEALRPALFEAALFQNKMQQNTEFGKALADHSWNVAQTGAAGLNAALLTAKGNNQLGDLIGGSFAGGGLSGYQTGITRIPHDMPAMLHAGEEVVSKANAGKMGGGKTQNITIYAQGVPASQIAHHIANLHRSD